MKILFGEWLPDQPGVIGALTTAKNVYPKAVGYGPFQEEETYSGDATEALNSVFYTKDLSGASSVFAGSESRLFKLGSNLALNDVSATTYSSTSVWKFTQFGNSLIAVNGANTIQRYDLTSTGNFANISSDAPAPKYVTVVRDFVVTGWQSAYPSRVQWSGINNEDTWTSSATTQSDFQDIPDGGVVQGVTGGEFGLVLLENSIVRMSYVGTPLIFQFDNISRNLGCLEPNSITQWQGITYFLGDDGFYACNGQTVEPIGAEKVNRFFFSTLDDARIDEMSATLDPGKNLVMFGYPSLDNTYRILVYHTPTKRWSYVDTNIARLGDTSSPSFTLEGLDAISPSLDNLQISLDSQTWNGGRKLVGGVQGTKLVTFSGSNKSALIDTSDLEENPIKKMITLAKPLVDFGSGNIAIASRDLLSQSVNFSELREPNSENRIGFRSMGRYHRVRLNPSGNNWQSALGVELEVQGAGTR